MKKYINILKKCPLFNDITEDNLLTMLNCLNPKIIDLDKKYTILAEGSKAKYLGIVLSGAVQIEQTDYFGNRSIISVSSSGEVFGESFACAEIESIPVTIIASEPSKVMLIEAVRIMNTCSNSCNFHRQLIFNLVKNLAIKNITFYQKIEITSKRTTREKLLSFLMLYAKKKGRNSFEIPFDRQALADYLEVDRSGLSAEISKLKKEGILENRKNHFSLIESGPPAKPEA